MADGGRLPKDQAARDAALSPADSFIVQAPAGSGKTELLTQRYLALLAVCERPEEILALTFTRKAAAEMRNRIVAALELARDAAAPELPHQRKTWELGRAAWARGQALGWDLHANPARLQVLTIDALCALLARQMPMLSRRGVNLRIAQRPRDFYRRAARSVFRSLDTDEPIVPNLESLLQHLDNQVGLAERLLIDMLASREQWLRHVVDPEHSRLSRASLEAVLADAVQSSLADLGTLLPEALHKELAGIAAYASRNAEDAAIRRQLADFDLRSGMSAADLPVWKAVRELLLTKSGKLRAKLTKRQGFPAPSGASNPDLRERREEYAERYQRFRAGLADLPGFVARLDAVEKLPTPRYTDAQWAIFQALIAVLPRAVAELNLAFQASGEVDFAEMARAALEALGDPQDPTDLNLALDYRIRHILVDEFQDTSQTQLRLLESLTAGWEPDDGRTLFLVGDPMQSIYRFREADVGIFMRARHAGVGTVPLKQLLLTTNFRAKAALVDWYNEAFAQVFAPDEDASSGAVTYAAASSMDEDGAGSVTVHPRFDAARDAEAEQVSELARAAAEAAPGESVAILVRSRSHLPAVLQALEAAGQPYRAIEVDALKEQPVVRDLLALTRALLQLADRSAWLALLRAPWCGLALADLYALAGLQRDATVWELIVNKVMRDTLSDDGRLRLARLKSVIAKALAERGRRSLRRWVEGTWTALGGPACMTGNRELRHAGQFFQVLEELDAGGDLDRLEALDEAIEGLFGGEDPAADGQLEVMTIHKAKGLEFDTVIVPSLGREPMRGGQRLLLWAETTNLFGESHLLLAPIHAAGGGDEIYDYVRHMDSERDRHEQTRLLYVAATRARRHLHLLGHTMLDKEGAPRRPAAASLLGRLWPAVADDFTAASGQAEAPTTGRAPEVDERARTIKRLPSSWLSPKSPQPKPWRGTHLETPHSGEDVEYRWASDVARHVGTAVHRVLLQITIEGVEGWIRRWEADLDDYLRRMLNMLGVSAAQVNAAGERAAHAVRNTLADERGRWLLSAHEDARSEYPLSGWVGDDLVQVILDRTFVDEQDVRWIVDYKTGEHQGGTLEGFLDNEAERYQAQLNLYARMYSGLEQRQTRVGLYFPMVGGWREWAP